MDFLVSTFGSAGDVFPMLGLALALRDRGHAVALATNPKFEPAARRHGVRFHPLGTAEGYDEVTADPALWKPRTAFRHVVRGMAEVVREQYDLHAAHAGDGCVGVTNALGYGALVAQEKLGRPVVTVHVQPAVVWSDREPPAFPMLFGPRWLKGVQFRLGERFVLDRAVAPVLGPLRAGLGLPTVRRVGRWWHSPYAVVCLFPDWYARPQPDWPGNLLQTDFPLWNDGSADGLSPDLDAFLAAGDPPLVFTPGTANRHAGPLFAAAVEACRRLGRRGVLLTGYPEQVPADLPAAVIHARYAPLDLLLPRAAGFVHHGGVGSTSQALAAGVPQLVVPLAHDQFDNARRVERLGAGGWLGVSRFTAPRAARRLAALLNTPNTARRELAGRLTARDGLRRAAAAIEERVKRG